MLSSVLSIYCIISFSLHPLLVRCWCHYYIHFPGKEAEVQRNVLSKAPELGHYRSKIGTWLGLFQAPPLIKGTESSQFHFLLHSQLLNYV